MGQTFDNIWYLPSENTWKDFQLLAYRDIGTLTLDAESITFVGLGNMIRITDIEEVTYGKQGRDFINNWVRVRSKNGDTGFFADGGWLGWRGILGGTTKVFKAVKDLRPSAAK